MTSTEKHELMRDIEASELMVKDLQRLYKSYAKKALSAKQERERRAEKKGFLEYECVEELVEAWGGAYIDEDTYYRGFEYFESLKKPPTISGIEQHRKNIAELINHWKGTITELNEELYPQEKMPQENAFDRLSRLEREERYKNMIW